MLKLGKSVPNLSLFLLIDVVGRVELLIDNNLKSHVVLLLFYVFTGVMFA